MKKFLLLLALLPALAFAQKQKPGVTYDTAITRVIDGDTVAFKKHNVERWLQHLLNNKLQIAKNDKLLLWTGTSMVVEFWVMFC